MSIELINQISKEVISSFTNLTTIGVKKEFTFEIDCETLEDYNYDDIRKSEKFKPIFDILENITGPVLYWFEVISDTKSDVIYQSLISYKTSGGSKATPALKSKPNTNSKILYVGKVRGSFWGRLITHLGFLKVNGAQGLQLFYWTKGLNLKLKLHLIEFNNDMADFIPILEFGFAKKFEPLFGKHN